MNNKIIYDATGDDFPWVYKRVFLDDNSVLIDCVAPNIELNIHEKIIIKIPFTNKTLLCEIHNIISRQDAPGIWQNKSFKENSHYKLILKFNPYER